MNKKTNIAKAIRQRDRSRNQFIRSGRFGRNRGRGW